jgi:hypothetical protein
LQQALFGQVVMRHHPTEEFGMSEAAGSMCQEVVVISAKAYTALFVNINFHCLLVAQQGWIEVPLTWSAGCDLTC